MDAMPIYSPQQLQAWMVAALPPQAAATRKSKSKKTDYNGDEKSADFEAVRSGCSWVDSTSTNPAMDEPSWYALTCH
jgi:hypothetical protein